MHCKTTPSGSIGFIVEELGSCVRVCDGSAPFKHDGFAECVQTICPGKPQRKALALVPHTGWQRSCLPTGKDSSRVREDLERGRALPAGHHISGVTGLLVPTGILRHLCCQPNLGLVWFCTCGSVHAVYPSEQLEQGLRSSQAEPALIFPPEGSRSQPKPVLGSAADSAE